MLNDQSFSSQSIMSAPNTTIPTSCAVLEIAWNHIRFMLSWESVRPRSRATDRGGAARRGRARARALRSGREGGGGAKHRGRGAAQF